MNSDQITCRICLDGETEEDDELITPCKCAGTMKYIHFKCLKEWLDSKKTFKESVNSFSCTWKQIECDLCREKFPEIIFRNDKRLNLFEYTKP